MIACQCNRITEDEIATVVRDLLDVDRWSLVVPNMVYHEMGKRGRCCGCFPNVVDIIVKTSAEYHASTPVVVFEDFMRPLDEMRKRLTDRAKRSFVAG